jgi:hypothetical protein
MKLNKFGHEIEFTLHSSSCPPGSTGMMTSDCATWFKVDDGEWKRCALRSQFKAVNLLDLAENEDDLNYIVKELEYEYN